MSYKQHHIACIKKLYSIFLAVIVCFCAVASMGEQVHAEDVKTVKIGYYAAKNFQDGAGDGRSKGGYSYEYIQKIASYTGWRYEYVYGSWADLYQKLVDGEIDIMAGVSYSKERENLINYPDSEMLNETFYIYTDARNTTIKCGEIDTYAGKKIGLLKDNKMMSEIFERWVVENQADVEPVIFDDLAACAEAFNKNEIDAFVSADNIVSGYGGIVPLEKIGKEPYYLCVSKQRTDLLGELNTALAVITEQDALDLDALRNKYCAETTVSVFLSKQERDWMDAHSEIHVGYVNEYLPYCDTAEDGSVDGLIAMLVPDLFDALPGNYKPKIIYHAYDSQEEMVQNLKDGTVDFVFPVNYEQWYSEQNGYQQSSAVIDAPVMLVYAGTYSDAMTEKIAVNRNNLLQYCYTMEKYPDAMIVLCDSIEDCIEAVKSGQAGATAMSSLRGEKYLNADKTLNKLTLTSNQKFCFGVAFGNSALLQILNHGITILGDGYGSSHIYQYLDHLNAYTASDFVKDNIGVFAFIAILILICVVIFFVLRERKQKKIAEKELKQKAMLEAALLNEQKASNARNVFLRSMSHDIRTPMNAVLGFANLAMNIDNDVEKIHDYLSKILVSGNHLLGIVNDVLEISRIESGQTKLDEQKWRITEVVDEADVIIRQRVQEKHQQFTVNVSQIRDDYVYCDKLKMKEILVNILDNAVKFTKDGGNISLTVIQLPSVLSDVGSYEIHIKDNGCGMSHEFLEKIFIPFERASDSTISGVKGTGLGMPIVKNFVEMMGGTIDVISEENVGTEFIVRISYRLAENEDAQVQEISEDIICHEQFKGKRLLLAEDNLLNQEIAVTILEDAGFIVETAQNGEEALDKVEHSSEGYYAAVLMDIRMPVMDGYEATKAIRKLEDKTLAAIPIIAVSANAFEEDKAASVEAGMNAHLAKPIDVSKLMEILAKILA